MAPAISSATASPPAPSREDFAKLLEESFIQGSPQEGAVVKGIVVGIEKDLAVQGKHKARFLNYWFDETTGTVTCLVEAPSAEDAVASHKEAHGLVPDAIDEVIEGR